MTHMRVECASDVITVEERGEMWCGIALPACVHVKASLLQSARALSQAVRHEIAFGAPAQLDTPIGTCLTSERGCKRFAPIPYIPSVIVSVYHASATQSKGNTRNVDI